MEKAYQRLAADVARAGGHLEFAPEALAARLQTRIDRRDAYAQHILKRRLAEVGLSAKFRDGGVHVTHSGMPMVPPPPAAPWQARSEPAKAMRVATPLPTNDDLPAPLLGGSADAARSNQPTADQVGNWLYGALVVVCTFVPAIGHQLFPGGDVGDKQEAFFSIYLATFPLSLAATFIFLMEFLHWFEDEKERLIAAGVAIVLSAVWGIGFGTSYADQSAISQLHGNVLMVAAQVVGLALFSYATYYGWALFIAGWLSSFFAALWIKEKLAKVQTLLA